MNEDIEALTARLDAAQEHLAYHLRDFRPGGDMKLTGDLAVDMASYAGRLKAQRDDLTARLAALVAVHWRYFDDEGTPGADDTTPEPEDVWRYDRDFRAALGADQ